GVMEQIQPLLETLKAGRNHENVKGNRDTKSDTEITDQLVEVLQASLGRRLERAALSKGRLSKP
ncbi:MAG: hypothetical protein ABI459_00890, partial [Deltaproteobacteria bacterium]